ncbi:MAG TPA: hypothetical protein VII12_06470 [Thermoanaerobaculia bacterium]
MAKVRDLSRLALPTLFVAAIPVLSFAQPQIPEQNINMVSGTGWPFGDPFLRQQNEPSMAVAKGRNPLHLLAAANDYRSVDIPFNAPARPDDEDTGDAWIGIFKSKDGGNTWWSTLLDGYPQLANSTSPLKGFQAAADPVVRAGNNGMFYVGGIVLNRGANPLGGVFVARFIDSNRTEVGDPIEYVDTQLVDKGTSGQFIDKPWLFVSPLPNAGQCTVNGQTFPAQNIYLAYSVFVGNDNNIRTKIMFAKSANCGATWDPIKLSETYSINQGATLAFDSTSGAIYAIWRRFHGGSDLDSIIMAKSTNGGSTFTKGTVVTNITPFEQGTTTAAVRTNAYPTAVVDDSGRLHIAWSQRDANGFGRIMLITSTDGGTSWSAPRQVDNSSASGHQFMPAMTFASGKLTLAWYDLRQDHTIGTYTKSMLYPGFYDESRTLVGNLALGQPQVVFWNYLADVSPTAMSPKLVRRHTLDVQVAEGDPAAPMMAFTTVRVSRYKFGSAPPHTTIQDLQINPPNLPMFRQGTVPFIGDYIDIASYVNSTGGMNALSSGSAASSSIASRVRHVVWTDNRDVRVPLGAPPDWTKYTPVQSPALGGTSKFDPTQTPPPCDVAATGSRNQNIYTTRVTDGLFAGSPGNAKPLGVIQRAFAVFAQNSRNTTTAYRLSFAPLPAGVSASFLQFGAPLTVLDITVPPHSTSTRTVFVTGPAHSRVDVNVREITTAGGGGTEVPGGLSSVVGLNIDPTNPDIGNPDIGNPDIGNAEVFNPDIGNPDIGNPDIGNPDIGNPDIGNPDIGNPDIGNPDIGNPDIGNPDIGNPDIGNPDIGNPDIGNPDIGNGAVTDTSWPAKNEGNTTGGFTVKLLKNGDLPAGFKTQLILNKIYDTPIARDCNLGVEHHRQVIANINNPTFLTSAADLANDNYGLTDSSGKSSTLWLAPGETGRITLRVVDPNRFDNITFDATSAITPVVIAQSVNTLDANGQNPTPSISLTILTTSLPDGTVSSAYTAALDAIGGKGTRTWTATGLPAGLTVSGSAISGTPQVAGTFSVTITVTDSATPPNVKSKTLPLQIHGEQTFFVNNTNDSGTGSLRKAILDANANQGFTDKIVFAIPGAGLHVITPASQLPGITDPVVIDATPSGVCNGGAPTVEIDGISAGLAHGLFVATGGTTIRGLAITRFASSEFAGIFIAGGAGSVIECSYLGLAADGVTAKGNYDGVRIGGSFNNIIGGASATVRNVLSGNVRNGVLIMGPTSGVSGSVMQTLIQGNFIGTDVTGTLRRGNGSNGVQIINSASNTIGGTGPARNVISGNNGEGIRIDGATATANMVQGNYIGTSVSGAADLGNNASGVYIRRAPGNSVVGNVVSGNNGFAGVAICGTPAFCGGGDAGTQGSNASGNVLKANLIGTNAAGTASLGNSGFGVSIDGAPNAVIGGPTSGDANVIAANGSDGVHIFGDSPDGNLIRSNSIGTDAGGTLNLGNSGAGVLLATGSNNTIGGSTAQNIIAFNGGAGISLQAGAGTGNLLRFNQIDSNVGLGIDLGANGVTANDAGDGDTGPNGLQNFPVISSVRTGGGTTTVSGTLQSTANTQFSIDFFYSSTCDGTGFGEGRTWFASFSGMSDGSGNLSFTSNLQFDLPADSIVTALATSSDNNTSEFSACAAAATTLAGGLQYPKGLFIQGGQAYLTETAGRNTSFGGKVSLDKVDLGSGAVTTLIDNPRNSDALVVSAGGKIYLTSYHDSIPGENGELSVAELMPAGTWQERNLTTIAIASNDMIDDTDGSNNLLIIGSSDQPTAQNLIRVLSPDYTQTQVIRTGLGRALSLTKSGTMTYYSVLLTNQVRRFSGEFDELFLGGVSVVSLDTDGTWIYYAELGGGIKRKHIVNGTVETLLAASTIVNTLRWNEASGRLYFAEAGTVAGQFKDGKLTYLKIR